jgi:hypothetical protein
MKLFLFNFYLFFSYHLVYSQKSGKIGRYYSLINDAELSIIDKKYQNAANLYKIALSISGDKMCSENLFNMFISCLDSKDTVLAIKPLKILRRRGWNENYYLYILQDFPFEMHNAIRNLYKKTNDIKIKKDTNYLNFLDSIIQIDQKMNIYYRAVNNGLIDGIYEKKYDSIVSEHIRILGAKFKKRFPSDNVIGHIEDNPKFGTMKYSVLLIHNMQGDDLQILNELYYKAIMRFEYLPEYLQYFNSEDINRKSRDSTVFINNEIKFNRPFVPLQFYSRNDSLFYFKSSKNIELHNKKLKIADEHCKKIIGLETIEELKRKITFQFYNNKYLITKKYYIWKWDPLFLRLNKYLVYQPKP